MPATMPSKLVICVGTYEGVLAGWEASPDDQGKTTLNLTFATPVHDGSIRALCLAAANEPSDNPGTLLSCGYDEMLRTHDWKKHVNSSGEVRTPGGFGTPTCSSFAPPNGYGASSTHCVLGFADGKLVLYKKRDWSVQHVLAGHEGGVAALAVHPSGKMALTGGQSDGKLKLWDLTKGRLAYVAKILPSSTHNGRTRYDPVCSLVWSNHGSLYGFAYGHHISVRDVDTGKDLLDVDVPGRVNEITIMTGEEGTFVAAACNDGSLPVVAVQNVDGADDIRQAIMAIQPLDDPVAGEERFKCIHRVKDYIVVTANSAGVVSLMNLEGAVSMIVSDEVESAEEATAGTSSPTNSGDDDGDDNTELAVDIIESVMLGTGARITCLATWCHTRQHTDGIVEGDLRGEEDFTFDEKVTEPIRTTGAKRQSTQLPLDSEMITKARELVRKAKKLKRRTNKKKSRRLGD